MYDKNNVPKFRYIIQKPEYCSYYLFNKHTNPISCEIQTFYLNEWKTVKRFTAESIEGCVKKANKNIDKLRNIYLNKVKSN